MVSLMDKRVAEIRDLLVDPSSHTDEKKKDAVEIAAIDALKSYFPGLLDGQAYEAWQAILNAIDTKAGWVVVQQKVVDFYREHL